MEPTMDDSLLELCTSAAPGRQKASVPEYSLPQDAEVTETNDAVGAVLARP